MANFLLSLKYVPKTNGKNHINTRLQYGATIVPTKKKNTTRHIPGRTQLRRYPSPWLALAEQTHLSSERARLAE